MKSAQRLTGTFVICLLLVTAQACRAPFASRGGNTCDASASLVILNAPVSGTVRRVLVGEGVAVMEGATVIEIAANVLGAAQATDDSQARARAQAQAAQSQVTAAQRELERARVEVQRVESLVATNAASQPELDAARAVYQRAQENADAQRSGAERTQDRLVFQSGTRQATTANTAQEQTVPVKASASGTVRVVGVRAGQTVTVGQPLATISVASR